MIKKYWLIYHLQEVTILFLILIVHHILPRFAHTEAQVMTESALTGSFAKIDISQLKTFVGDVARVKVFRKSKNAIGDFQFVQESKLESIELLRDIATVADTELSYGEFDLYNLTNYWNTGSNSPITLDNSVLKNSLHIDYIGSGVDTISTEQTLSITEGVEYAINFKTLLSGSFVTSFEDSYVRAYLSGSDYEQELLTASGSAIYKTRQNISQNILASQTVSDTHLKFDVKGDDWFISNISLRNAQETSFSPDEFTLIQDIPRKTASETFDFRFEFYDVNNNFIPVNVVSTKEFDGGNDFPSSDKLLTFEADRNAFRFSSGSIGNPPFQQIQLKTSTSNLVGSLTFASSAFDASGVFIDPSSYTGTYPGTLTNPSNAGAIITIENFSGSDDTITVGSIVYTASLDGVEEFETVFRLEDGDNAPQLIVTSNANQFIYEPTTLSPKPSGQSLTVKAQRKNLASLVTPVTVNSGSNKPALTFVDTVNGIDTYTISATEFSSSFASSDFDSVTYEFTGSDVFGNEQSDEITLSKVINFDAVSLVLSNESTSFPAKSTGEVLGDLTPSSGSVQMFIGGTQIQHDDGLSVRNRFDITGIAESNVTASVNPPTDEFYSISGFDSNKDSGSLTLDIKYLAGDNVTSQSFQKIVSYTKAKKAVPTVLTKISPSTQTINSSSLGYDSPQTMEVIVQEGGNEYTFDSSNLSGGGDALAQKFNINSLFVDSGSISNSDNILTFGSLTSSFNSIIGSASLDYVDSEGTYVTGKKVRFDLAVSKIGVDGVNGASGSNARAVSLSSTKYAVVYDGDGVLFPTSQPFTLSGSAQNFSNPQFQFLQNGSDISDGFGSVSELIIPTTTGSLPTAGGTNLYEVRVRETGGSWDDFNVLDNIDIFGVQSGSDAFTVFLTNEAHVFSATSESVVTSNLSDGSFETRFFRGADQYNLGTTGKTYSISATSSSIELTQSTNSNQKLFTPTSISADSGSATITVTDNNTGQTFDKQYSFTLSKEGLVGERGADGANGASGSNAKIVSLSSTKYAVVYDGDGTLFPTDQNFNLSGSAQNFTNPEFQFLSASAVLHDFASTSEVTISSSGYPEAGNATLYEVRVRENGGSYEGVFDNIDVFGVQSGSDSFTTFLTNEAHVFSANSDGVVTSTLADGSFETRFFRGADQYDFGTSGKSYSVSATSSSIELTQSTNSNQRKFTPSSVSADSGTASIILTDNNTGQTFPKTYTFSKSKKGAPVTTIAASPQSQTITSGSGGIGTPADITITVNEGGNDYTHTTGTVGEEEFKITGVTNGTDNTDGTISPDTPTSSTPVVGDVTISYTNSEGTAFTGKTIPFDVGVAGLGDTGPKGDTGDPGGQGDAGLRTAQGMVHYSITSSTEPTGPDTSTDSFNFSTGVMSNMTSDWQMGTPTYESGNSNKYWYATFSSVENSSGAGIATGTNNSFGTVTQAIGFSGLVSFTATDTIGDGTDNLSFGVAGSTLINGDNISTGRIISTNYVTGSGDGFTNTGTEFNLDEGLIASKNINILPNGDAKFKGDLTGASGTFSGTVQVGGTSLTSTNTLNANTTAGDVGLGSVLDQAQTTTFRQNGIPTATAAGDIWIDTNDNNKMYVATSAGDNQVTAGEWELSNVNKSAIGLSNVDNQSANTIQAGTTAADVGLPNLDNTNFDSTGSIIGGAIGGVTIAATKLYQGTGTWANSNTGFYLDNGANFSLQDKLAFNGNTGDLAISGSIFAESGTFAGDVAGATISVPVSSPKFTVTSAGILSAQTASIEGTITATGGRIGEFDIAGSKLSGKGEYMVLDASETPNIYFYSGSGAGYTTIVKLSSADALTPIELSTAPAMGGDLEPGGTPFTGATDVNSQSTSGTTFATTTQNPTHLYDELSPTSTYRFPSSGNLTSDHVGLEMTVNAVFK